MGEVIELIDYRDQSSGYCYQDGGYLPSELIAVAPISGKLLIIVIVFHRNPAVVVGMPVVG
jgi:hypothetical protein